MFIYDKSISLMLNCIIGIDIYIFLNFFFLWKFVLHTLVVDNYLSKSKNVSQTEILGMHRLYIYILGKYLPSFIFTHSLLLSVGEFQLKYNCVCMGKFKGGKAVLQVLKGENNTGAKLTL